MLLISNISPGQEQEINDNLTEWPEGGRRVEVGQRGGRKGVVLC